MPSATSKQWYTESAHSRALELWRPPLRSAEVDYERRRPLTAGRARDVVMSSAFGANAARIHRDNVVGPRFTLALRPLADLLKITPEQAKTWSRLVEREWSAYAQSPTFDCDAQRMLTFPGMLHMAYWAFLTGGEALGVFKWKLGMSTGYNTCVQMVEAERLSTPPDKELDKRIRNGIELDDDGMPVAYHIRKVHPSDMLVAPDADGFKWERVARFEPWGRPKVLHMFDRFRPDMQRGISAFVTALRGLKMVDEYNQAELESAVLKAGFAAVVKTELAKKDLGPALGAPADLGPAESKEAEDALQYMLGTDPYRKAQSLTVNGARAVHLLPGESLELLQTTEGGISFEAFQRALINELAAGTGVSSEQLSRDFGEMSFASAKVALGDVWRHFFVRREMIVRQMGLPWVSAWLEEAVDQGKVPLPTGKKGNALDLAPMRAAIFANSTFMSWGPPVIEPVKEAEGQKIRLGIGTTTLAQEAQEAGDDWEEILEQQAAERKKRTELGLPQIEELESKDKPPGFGGTDDPDEDGKGGEKKGKDQRRA